MKNTLKFAATLMVVSLLSINACAQNPPPPNSGGGPTSGNTAVGGGNAPIGTGLFLLLGLTGAYVGKKVYDFKNGKMEE